MKKIFISLMITAIVPQGFAGAHDFSSGMEKVCAQSVVTEEGSYGKEYFINPTQMDFFEGRQVIAAPTFLNGGPQIHLRLVKEGSAQDYFIPFFDFKRVLLTETSVWFLSEDRIREFDFSLGKFTGNFPSYPDPWHPQLTNQARGFSYAGGVIYIAHGGLGVSVFDVETRKHRAVIKAGLQPGSMAAAVAVRGDELYILQGAYHPKGFNGVAIVGPSSSSEKLVSYPRASGVVDPYSSSLKIAGNHLVINNSGWIHTYLLSSLRSGPSSQAPAWLAVVESVETAAGNFDKYLKIEGDFIVSRGEILACSSVSYVPLGQSRPIKEWRMIRKTI